MPKSTATELSFGCLGRCLIQANFEGGALSFDGGLMLLRQTGRYIAPSAARSRDPERITHSLRDLVAQSLYGCLYKNSDTPPHQ